jgi:hypothetical protein
MGSDLKWEPGMPQRNWQRRHAIQIVAQLPDNPRDALLVLELAKQFVEGFLVVDQPRKSAEVKLISASCKER